MNSQRIQQLLLFLQESPDDVFILHALGLEYMKTGNSEKAIEYFRRVIQTDANYVGTYYQLAKVYESTGDFVNAKKTYISGMETATKIGDTHTFSELSMALEILEDDM